MEPLNSIEVPRIAGTLSVVIPCYNEEESLPILRRRLVAALDKLGVAWEAVLVDDGSRDRTRALLEEFHQQDPRFRMLGLSRNFGHQAAVLAGLSAATGAVVAVMDADLQDPPEILEECLEKWKAGFHVVFAIRTKRKEGILKRASYSAFYRLLRQLADVEIPLDSGDFCLMDR
ncbi:MAG TPA: glycosyltransferase family 2 protein, partial [Armatimonadota bacterium]|nr:glycosyltransferase family 2 protein [Armatimonadota bacterium]